MRRWIPFFISASVFILPALATRNWILAFLWSALGILAVFGKRTRVL